MEYTKDNIRQEYWEEIEKAITVFKTDFPVVEQMVKIIHCKEVAKEHEYSFATSRISEGRKIRYEIKLNPLAFSEPEIEDKFKKVRKAAKANYESISDIIYHEFGHSLQPFLLCRKWRLKLEKYNWYNFRKYEKLDKSPEAIETYEEYFSKFIKEFGWNHEKIEKHLGSYATNNCWEMLPECFNNYYRLKDKECMGRLEQETYKFVSVVVEDYKKYIPDTLNYFRIRLPKREI